MANISRLQVKEDVYDIKDNVARSNITGINSSITSINGKNYNSRE